MPFGTLQRRWFDAKKVQWPEWVFEIAKKSQPRRSIAWTNWLGWFEIPVQNPAHIILVELDLKRVLNNQGDFRTTEAGIFRFGSIRRAQNPKSNLSTADKWGHLRWERLTTISCCLIRMFSAMIFRKPPGRQSLKSVMNIWTVISSNVFILRHVTEKPNDCKSAKSPLLSPN